MQRSKQCVWNVYPDLQFSIEGIQKGYLFREKWYVKGKELDLGTEPLLINICSVPHSPNPNTLSVLIFAGT